jgi:MYXO-CTERM domain-containing protein
MDLEVGDYTTADLLSLGALNNDASSLQISPGYEVTLFAGDDFTGTQVVLTAETSCLVEVDFNDVMSSLRVEAVGGPTGVGGSGLATGGAFGDGGTSAAGGSFLAGSGGLSTGGAEVGLGTGTGASVGTGGAGALEQSPRKGGAGENVFACSAAPSPARGVGGWFLVLLALVASATQRRRRAAP